MDATSELVSCCRDLLETEKITERKKLMEKFIRCVNKSSVIRDLDHNSDLKSKSSADGGHGTKHFAWDNVFKVVKNIVLKEADLLKKAKAANSQTSLTNREKKKQEISNLFKMVVRLANKRGQRLRGSDVIQHILHVVGDDFLCPAFGIDYCNVFLKDILSVRKYACDISSKLWHELLAVFCQTIHQSDTHIHRGLLAQIIHVLIEGSTRQCDVRPKKLLLFFSQFFQNVRNEKSVSVKEHMLCAMNLLCQAVAANNRTHICQLGEDVFISLLNLWTKQPSTLLKDQIVEFYQLQMCAHHPRGSKAEEPGAYAAEWAVWKSHMRKLYEVIYEEFMETAKRSKITSGKKIQLQKQAYIDLAADLCYQLFSEGTAVIEVTQMPSTASRVGGSAVKKRRLETGWQLLSDTISQSDNTTQILPWLQLLSALVERYPGSVPDEHFYPLLSCLQQLLSQSKKVEVTACLQQCLRSFVRGHEVMSTRSATVTSSCIPVWQRIWLSGLRLISLNHSREESFRLLTVMLDAELIVPDKEMWLLFQTHVCPCTDDALAFLATYIKNCDLPETHTPNTLITVSSTFSLEKHRLRAHLIHWMLPNYSDDDTPFAKKLPYNNFDYFANVIVSLSLRDTSDIDLPVRKCDVENSRIFENLQDIYLKTTFDMPLESEEDTFENDRRSKVNNCPIRTLVKEIESLLVRDIGLILEVSTIDQSQELSLLQCLADYSCLVMKVLYYLVRRGIISCQDVRSSQLTESLVLLMKKISAMFNRILHGNIDGTLSALLQILKSLDQLSRLPRQQEIHGFMEDFLRCVIPAKLVDQLLDLAAGKIKLSRSASGSGVQRSRHVSNRKSAFDDLAFDDDFDVVDEPMAVDNDFDDFEESQDENQTENKMEGSTSLISLDILSESDLVRLEALRVLCGICNAAGRGSEGAGGSGDAGVRVHEVRKKLTTLLDTQDGWDATKPLHLQMLFCIIEDMESKDQHICDGEMEVMLTALRTVFKVHRRDQDLCKVSLRLLSCLVPHLSCCESGTNALLEFRESALHLMSVLWKLQGDGHYSTAVRKQICKCMICFIQNDPDGSWSKWKTASNNNFDDSDDESSDQKVALTFIDTLKDASQEVRLEATAAIKSLFLNTKTKEGFDRITQDRRFDKIYSTLQEVLTIESTGNPDESVNRTSSFLHCLATMAQSSGVCEKKAIFAFCLDTKDKNIDLKLTKKVLEAVSTHLGHGSVSTLLTLHLPYLIGQWLDVGYRLLDFPYQLLDQPNLKEFYSACYPVLIPQLLMHKDMAAVQTIGTETGASWEKLLTEVLSKIIIHILPYFAMSKTGNGATQSKEIKKKIQHANSCYELLINTVTEKAIDESIAGHLDEIVVDILLTLYEPCPPDSNGLHFARSSDPEPGVPHFDTTIVTATLDYLTQCHATDATSLVSLLSKSQDCIQKILLSLSQHLSMARRPHEKRRVMLMYRLFVKLLLKEFSTKLGSCWAFVLRDVIHTVINNLKTASILEKYRKNPSKLCELKDEELFVNMCCHLLTDVCEVAVNQCHEELGRFLPTIVSPLVQYVDYGGEIGSRCMRLLQMLVVDRGQSLGKSVALLDSFPDTERFTELRRAQQHLKYATGPFSLRQELDHFLSARHETLTTSGRRVEGLRFLRQQLASRKRELANTAAPCQGGDSSPLVKVVSELVNLVSTADKELVHEIGRCLGEIGPGDLAAVTMTTTQSNQALETAQEYYKDDGQMLRECQIFHLLSEYLVDTNVDIVIAASQVLKKLLSTQSGIGFSSEYRSHLPQDRLFQYLHPFKSSKKRASSQVSSGKKSINHFRIMIKDPDLWSPDHNDHNAWIINLVCALIDSGGVTDEILRLLQPICKVKVKFCEVILPFLIHDTLSSGIEELQEILSEQISGFISSHCGLADQGCSRPTTPVSHLFCSGSSICTNIRSVKCMLSVIQYLRLQDKPTQGRQKTTAWENNFWLSMDYLQLAKAAKNCSAYFTTLLFAEIWCDTQRSERPPAPSSSVSSSRSSQSQPLSQGSQMDALSTLSEVSGVNVQQLLLEAYRSIGDPDGVYGCGAGRLADSVARIQTYEHENDWGKALTTYDLDMDEGQTSTKIGLLQALQKFGANHVLETYLQGLNDNTDSISKEYKEFQYEAAWKTCNWNLETPARLRDDCGFHQAVYSSLQCLRDGEFSLYEDYLDVARSSAVASVGQWSLESMRSLYPVLSALHCLTQISDVAAVVVRHKEDGINLKPVITKWEQQDAMLENDFDFIEPILQMRCSLLHLVLENATTSSSDIQQQLIKSLQHLARTAVEESRHQVAERVIHTLRRRDETDRNWTWKIEEASMYWSRGEHHTAKNLIKSLIDSLSLAHKNDKEAALLYPQCLGIYGNWLSETRSESPNVVMENYLNKAVLLYEKQRVLNDQSLDAYMSLARYADGQYQNIVNHMKSSTFEAKQALVKRAKADAEKLKQIGESTRYRRTLEKQSNIDEQELSLMNEDKTRFLLYAARNYIKCLAHGNQHDLRVFRLTSLWFDNATNPDLMEIIQEGLDNIKSYKFLPLMYQLAARMSTRTQDSEVFQTTLDKLIERVVLDHPHHTLSIILALAHANKDDEIVATPSSGRSKRGSVASRLTLPQSGSGSQGDEEDRVMAAKKMIERLRRSKIAAILKNMELLSCAYIQLANFNVDQFKRETKPISLPSELMITKMKHLTNVAVPTVQTRVAPSCDYSDIVHVDGFAAHFRLAGGINLPKIITCVSSDGVNRRQLVKGKDDLRQDAVMQQVFGMVNNLLKKDKECHKRALTVRTYKVIPLSQRSGLLEWCEGTQPLGDYLIGSSGACEGAHQRYNPSDLKPTECRTKLAKGQSENNGRDKCKVFLDICKKFQPVFRHFFMEKFRDPALWYERRQAYTRSVATSSIVGYILGLGDRHVMNILIDCQTAELVHIDLGVAFEQGKILPTPETVPFRLTRDLVDGMGVAGVEGVFRRSCEKTMEVMRANHEALLTILEVLLYDPLYAWTLSPQKAYALQQLRDRQDHDTANLDATTIDIMDISLPSTDTRENSDSVNKVAERVLLRLRQKLAGVEDNVTLSISGQINHLIQEARDPKNLCRVFAGWQPYI